MKYSCFVLTKISPLLLYLNYKSYKKYIFFDGRYSYFDLKDASRYKGCPCKKDSFTGRGSIRQNSVYKFETRL